jgi:hypothetical protein
MELTVQVKNAMPKAMSIRRAFKGITFKQPYAHKLKLTDRAPPITQNDLPFSFDNEYYIDPLDEILKEDSINRTQEIKLEFKPFSPE